MGLRTERAVVLVGRIVAEHPGPTGLAHAVAVRVVVAKHQVPGEPGEQRLVQVGRSVRGVVQRLAALHAEFAGDAAVGMDGLDRLARRTQAGDPGLEIGRLEALEPRRFEGVGNREDRGAAQRALLSDRDLEESFRRRRPHVPGQRVAQTGGQRIGREVRPFARRRFRISRPPFVFMRARKPWTRLRRTLLG